VIDVDGAHLADIECVFVFRGHSVSPSVESNCTHVRLHLT
jgi:hypothetical protein